MPNKTVSNNLKSVALYLLLLLAGAAIFYPPYRIVRDNTIQALNAQQLILARQAAKGIEEHYFALSMFDLAVKSLKLHTGQYEKEK